jgi:tetratricopeptide (TPR) repeat protein
MPPPPSTHLKRRQSLVLLLVVLGLAGVLAWRGTQYYFADRALDKGRSALHSGDSAAARGWFDRALDIHPQDPEIHFLSAIAARRAGDQRSATSHLEEAGRYGWDPVAVRAEAALQAASAGAPFSALEPALRPHVDSTSENTCDVLSVLVRGYLLQFRVAEADTLTGRWVVLAPEDPNAWETRADVLERLERLDAAREAYGRWVELDPTARKARLGLVRLLLEVRRPPSEITPHLEMLMGNTTNDPEVLRFQAAALQAQGRTAEAVDVLDRAVASPAPGAVVLAQRAKLDLDRGKASDALPFAQKAVAADSSDVEARFTLFRCIQQVGTPAEAAAAEASWKKVRDDLARVRELGRKISSNPTDAALRSEMGELFLRNGRELDGLRWLESALSVHPDFARAHRVLADFYTQTNRPDLAREHLNRANP